MLCMFTFISKSVNNQCYKLYIFGKIFSSSTIWCKENGRIRKFIATNFSMNFIFQKEIDCYKFSNSSVFFRPYCRAPKDLSEKVWVVALIVYRFRDNRKKKHFTYFKRCKFKLRSAPRMRASLNYVFTGISRSL